MKSFFTTLVLTIALTSMTYSQDRGMGLDGFTSVCTKTCGPQGMQLEVYKKDNSSMHIIKLFHVKIQEYTTSTRKNILGNDPSIDNFYSQLITHNGNATNNQFCDRDGNTIWGTVYLVSYDNNASFTNGETTSISSNGNDFCKDYTFNELLKTYELYKIQNSPSAPNCTSFECGSPQSGGAEQHGGIHMTNDPDVLQQEAFDNSPNKPVSNQSPKKKTRKKFRF
ncbi:MAG: hypothetical protein AB3N16_00505 [Flavobacteriaceae bacterium]